MEFILLLMLGKLIAVLVIIPLMAFGISFLLKKGDEKDTRWNLKDINGRALPTAIYAGLFTLGVYIFFGLVFAAALIGISM